MKIFIFIILISFCFFSCDFNPTDTVITNHSDKYDLVIKFKSSDELVITPGNNISIKTSTESGGMRLEYYSPEKRLIMAHEYASRIYNFFDRPSYNVSILNLSGQSGVLAADDWMEAISFTSSNTEQSYNNWLLYTSNPTFIAKTNDGYLLQVLCIASGSLFKVTIN